MVSSPCPISIVIADDHPALTDGLQRLLEIEPDLRVIGHASNAADVVQCVLELKPDILLLDLKMPSQQKMQISARGGLDAWAAVKGSGCTTKAILFAADMETQQIVEAIELGVRGVLLKSEATGLLIESIRAVMNGACWKETMAVPNFHEFLRTKREELARRKFGLTPRELEVASAIVLYGMPNKDIAQFFKIAQDTVKKHITSIFDKLGVSSRLELVQFARKHKLPLRLLERRPTPATT
jgi:two-component system, NarL family, nitrate/nitrite response regulator NarL